jgi:hypothetical protein
MYTSFSTFFAYSRSLSTSLAPALAWICAQKQKKNHSWLIYSIDVQRKQVIRQQNLGLPFRFKHNFPL